MNQKLDWADVQLFLKQLCEMAGMVSCHFRHFLDGNRLVQVLLRIGNGLGNGGILKAFLKGNAVLRARFQISGNEIQHVLL